MNTLKQISVFARNLPGKIKQITGLLSEAGIDIKSISVSSGGDFGVIKLITDKPDESRSILESDGMTVSVNEVLTIEMPDTPGGLDKVAGILAGYSINIENASGFVIEAGKRAAFIIEVKDPADALSKLKSSELKFLEAKDIIEPHG